MGWKKVAVGAGVGAGLFLAGWATAAVPARTHPQTEKNLMTAIKGEAFAHAKYLYFARQARERGDTELADLFQKVAADERLQHFYEQAELAHLGGTDVENLRAAIQGESYEVSTMYRQFAEQARAVGDHAAAARFEEIRQDEAKHRDLFQEALRKRERALQGRHPSR